VANQSAKHLPLQKPALPRAHAMPAGWQAGALDGVHKFRCHLDEYAADGSRPQKDEIDVGSASPLLVVYLPAHRIGIG
jgi:hypothetical protein